MKDREKLEEYSMKGGLLIAMVIAAIAAFQLYFSLGRLIEVWLNYKYQPIFQALYSLAVLTIALYFVNHIIVRKT